MKEGKFEKGKVGQRAKISGDGWLTTTACTSMQQHSNTEATQQQQQLTTRKQHTNSHGRRWHTQSFSHIVNKSTLARAVSVTMVSFSGRIFELAFYLALFSDTNYSSLISSLLWVGPLSSVGKDKYIWKLMPFYTITDICWGIKRGRQGMFTTAYTNVACRELS